MKTLLSSIFLFVTATLMAQTDVYLNIGHYLAGQPFSKQTTATNNLGNTFNVSRLQYYVAEIVLIHDGGTQTPVTDMYLLVNATDTTEEMLGSFNITTLEGIQFGIGVDQAKNHDDPSSYPANHPLAPKAPSMHWGWAAGYRFVALEGKSGANLNQTYEIHALDDINYFKQTISTAGVMNGNAITIALDANYEKALADINVSSGLIEHGSTGAAVSCLANFNWKVFTSSEGNQAMSTDESDLTAITFGPNPSNGMDIRINGFDTDMHYQLFDLTGKLVQEGSDDHIEVNTLSGGMYFVSLSKMGDVIQTEKLIINK